MTTPETPAPTGESPAPAPASEAAPTLQSLAAALQALQERVAVLESRAVTQLPDAAVRTLAAPTPAPAGSDPLVEIKVLLRNLFALAAASVATDVEGQQEEFEAFKALMHRDRQGSPLLEGDLRKYKWLPFLGRYQDYLGAPDQPESFLLERVMPDRPDHRTEVIKVHLVVRGGRRMSPPVQFRRDSGAANAFRVEQMSI